MENQTTLSASLWGNIKTVSQRLQECSVCSFWKPISHLGRSLNNDVEQTFYARATNPVISDANDLEVLTPNHFVLGKKNVYLPYLSCAEDHPRGSLFNDHGKFFGQTQAYANLRWNSICKKYLKNLNNRQKQRCTTNLNLKEGNLVWLIENSNQPGCYKLGRAKETIDGCDVVIRRAIIRTKEIESIITTKWAQKQYNIPNLVCQIWCILRFLLPLRECRAPYKVSRTLTLVCSESLTAWLSLFNQQFRRDMYGSI